MSTSAVSTSTNFSEHLIHIKLSIKGLSSLPFWGTNQEVLEKELAALTVEQTAQLLESLCADLASDPEALTTLERLAPLVRHKNLNGLEKLKEAKLLFQQARYAIESKSSLSNPLKDVLLDIFYAFISAIEALITAFGIGTICQPTESEIQGSFKAQQMIMLLQFFAMITTMLLPLLGVEQGAYIIGGTFLGISALSVLYPYIRPMPVFLTSIAKHWNKEIRTGKVVPEARPEKVKEMRDILARGNHVMLKGLSRTGKTFTARELAQAVERGDFPEFEGYQFFYINTADLINQGASFMGGGNEALKKISDAMGRHRNKIVLVIDEIHNACKKSENVAGQLLTYLDQGGLFPHVIGITTDAEYAAVIQNSPFDNRFEKVTICNTEVDETMQVLADTVLKSSAQPIVKGDVFMHLWERTKDKPQPYTAERFLGKAISLAAANQPTPAQKQMMRLEKQLKATAAKGAASTGAKAVSLTDLEKELTRIQGVVKKEALVQGELIRAKALFVQLRAKKDKEILKVHTLVTEERATVYPTHFGVYKLALLLHDFLEKAVLAKIEHLSQKLGIQTIVDASLLDKVLVAETPPVARVASTVAAGLPFH